MNVGDWLRRLGLEEYEAAFRENEIDEFLPSLTTEDLKDLGLAVVGHRGKLLNAIATLQAEAGAPAPLSDLLLATDKAAEDTAERRHVTVMFSDLVGSTALSARMDPEDPGTAEKLGEPVRAIAVSGASSPAHNPLALLLRQKSICDNQCHHARENQQCRKRLSDHWPCRIAPSRLIGLRFRPSLEPHAFALCRWCASL